MTAYDASVRTLVLWDIDHTLLHAGGLSADIYAEVFHRVVGRPAEHVAPMAGRTDRAITTDTLRHHGVDPTPDVLEAFTDELALAFEARAHELAARGRTHDGARDVLEALAARPDVIQSVLTGNMARIAACKLKAFGLDAFLDLEIGAYGMDGVERPPLVELARERTAAKYGERFGPSSTVLIGDTPHDVRAGHEGGARVVAVATGATSAADLRLSGADTVLPDLSDTAQVVALVLGVAR
ncbi:Phosphoglycolate phosphatase [Actinomadura sp. RB99]|nr:Phosphoglycolate phosphatase [Actinomadura sp. RB99]